MMKFVLIAVLAAVMCKLVFKRWPWELWAASERSQKQAQARALLGVSRNAGREEILAAHRRALIAAHPDKGGSNEAVHEIDTARDLLLEQKPRKND